MIKEVPEFLDYLFFLSSSPSALDICIMLICLKVCMKPSSFEYHSISSTCQLCVWRYERGHLAQVLFYHIDPPSEGPQS